MNRSRFDTNLQDINEREASFHEIILEGIDHIVTMNITVLKLSHLPRVEIYVFSGEIQLLWGN